MNPVERLHPALQHHIVNSLGWRSLRPLQEAAIEPLLAREHALLLAPTAGGKTEGALFPLLSRMLTENWRGLGLLYVCPIKALLNNLHARLSYYAGFVGRRTEVWHGDVGEGARQRIRREPPDILLTTPESIEAMLVSRRGGRDGLFGGVQAVVVDELHAFAGDDRGWHLLAVLERVTRIAGRELQRVGLSATIGNPEELLEWLAGVCVGGRRVIAPPAEGGPDAEVGLDYVGTIENAATVIARLHRGEKRLVFVDSRSRVEELAAGLRDNGVSTFVSHSSLAVEERRAAELAFAEGSNCVIVATSTLELGIDVGDLDHVIQIDAPTTVSSFLQRLGRTGRRSGTQRNCLFLATTEDDLLRAAGLIQLWSEGWVEPVEPPPSPLHVLAQQIMALALQTGGIGRSQWREWIQRVPAFACVEPSIADEIVNHMLETQILFEENGILWFGPEGERAFGRRHFMELLSVFTSPPLFGVLYGRSHLGEVHPASFVAPKGTQPVLLLAGRSWLVTHVSWDDRTAYVEPTKQRGRSRWLGAGQALSFELCRAIRRVLARRACPGDLSTRAQAQLEQAYDQFSWVDEAGTMLVRAPSGELRWWTFAGLRANSMLASHLGHLCAANEPANNSAIQLHESTSLEDLNGRLTAPGASAQTMMVPVPDEAVEGLKFSKALPKRLSVHTLEARLTDTAGLKKCLDEPRRSIAIAG